jgi:hypothetical protein
MAMVWQREGISGLELGSSQGQSLIKKPDPLVRLPSYRLMVKQTRQQIMD